MHFPPAWAPLAQPAWLTEPLPLGLPGNEKQRDPRTLRLPRVQAEVDGRTQNADSPKCHRTYFRCRVCGLGAAGITPLGLSLHCLSLSLSGSLNPAKARTTWGVSALGHRAEQRGSKSKRQSPSWKSEAGNFCLSRHMWAFVSSLIHHSFIQQGSPSLSKCSEVQLCSLA